MKTPYKYIVLYSISLLFMILVPMGVNTLRDKNISFQKEVLLKQAQTLFKEQVNTRAWNALYGGVYVFPRNGLKPNPYLPDNTLETASGETLIKINPAWMTRQLSELSNTQGFHFRITSLSPINPKNEANAFEKKALEYLEKTNDKEYYEIEENSDFKYMGALVTTQDCLSCHAHQGYKLGDIRGGISISLDTANYKEIVEYIINRASNIKLLIIFLLASIALLIHKQMKNNDNLEVEVLKQTKEIETTKILLQELLDTDKSFLMVAEEDNIIIANKTMLDFFNVPSLEAFKKENTHISNAFVDQEEDDFLSTYMEGEHWISYLSKHQKSKEFKVVMSKDGEQRYFKVHSKKLNIDSKKLNIIIFDDVTEELNTISSLEEKASKDALTNLFNKGKFNEVLEHEIRLAQTTDTAFTIIFLDIDHFKKVNDTYGHDAGDYVLIELAKILLASVRQGDFIARWGGEEFVVALQATTADQGAFLAEKLRRNVEEYNFVEGGAQKISLGVTQYIDSESKEEFIKRVDTALYEAKNTGRNKVVVK